MDLGSVSKVETNGGRSVIQQLFSRSMKVLAPIGYFPPISYFAWFLRHGMQIETKEHFVKQTLRNRCTIMGANGPLHLLVPRTKTTERQTIEHSLIHNETDWKRLHWRSLEAAYRKSPYFEYYEDELLPFFETEHTHHLAAGLRSIELVCSLMNIDLNYELTSEYEVEPTSIDLRSAWNKQEYSAAPPITDFPEYIQVFRDRHAFVPDLSILDLLFCVGPQSLDYLNSLSLREYR